MAGVRGQWKCVLADVVTGNELGKSAVDKKKTNIPLPADSEKFKTMKMVFMEFLQITVSFNSHFISSYF